jgi:predicted ferric reductase
MYEVFLKLHYALSAVVVYALWRLFEASQRERILLIITVSIHASLSLLRIGRVLYRNTLRKSLWSRARIIKCDEGFEVTLSVPRPFEFKPNQYIYLCVPGLTPGSFLKWHPFSISWWSCNDAGQAISLSLLVKPQHGLTQHLMRCPPSPQDFYVAIDGPYGQGIDTSQYGTLILLATGIGIAAQMPLIKQTLAEYKASRTSVRKICVIWQMDQECK